MSPPREARRHGAPLIPPPRTPTARRAGGARPRDRAAATQCRPFASSPGANATRQPARLQSPISGSAAWTSGRGKRSTRAASTSAPSIQTRTAGHGPPPRSWHQPPTTNAARDRPRPPRACPSSRECPPAGPVSPDQSDESRERVGTTRRPPSRRRRPSAPGLPSADARRTNRRILRDRRSTGTRGARSQRTQFVSGRRAAAVRDAVRAAPRGSRAAAWAIPSA